MCFFFNNTATTEIYTLSLHDALPICALFYARSISLPWLGDLDNKIIWPDRKSTRLNSSHVAISYAVFCLKKKMAQSPVRPSHDWTGIVDQNGNQIGSETPANILIFEA